MIEYLKYLDRLYVIKRALHSCSKADQYEYGTVLFGVLDRCKTAKEKQRFISMAYGIYIANGGD